MKKTIFQILSLFLAVLVLSIFLSGCRKETIAGLPMPQSVEGLNVGDVTYYVGPYPGAQGGGQMLCCIPKAERMPVPVCSKSGCQHNGSDCGAYYLNYSPEELCSLSSSVGFFGDRLFTVSLLPERKIAVYSVDPATAERRLELTLNPQEVYDDPLSNLAVYSLFHENELILLYTRSSENTNGPIHRMVCVNLTTMREQELFRSHFDEAIGTQYMTVLGNPLIVGNMLYLFEDGPGSLPDSDNHRTEHRFSQLDLATGEVNQLLRDNDLYTWRIEGETVFFSDQHEKQFKELDLATSELRVIPSDGEIIGSAFILDDLIVCVSLDFNFETQETTACFDFYSRDYAHIDRLEYPDELVLFLATEEALYFRGGEEVYYLERNDVGSNHLKPQVLG